MAALQVLLHFGWQRIAVLGTNDAFSSAGADLLVAQCAAAGIDVIPTERWLRGQSVDVVSGVLNRLRTAAPELRVLVAFVHSDTLQVVVQAALATGMYGTGYALFSAANQPLSGLLDNPTLAPVVNGMLVLQRTPYNTAALTSFYTTYAQANFPHEPTPSMNAALAYDATYLVARALRATKAADRDPTDGAALMASIQSAAFDGVTGSISFTSPAPNQNERDGELSYYTLLNLLFPSQAPAANALPIATVKTNQSFSLSSGAVFGGGVSALPASCAGGTYRVVSSVQQQQQVCLPCSPGSWAGENADHCQSCITGSQQCPFASPIPLPADFGLSARASVTQPPPSGSLTSDSQVRSLFVVFALIGLGTTFYLSISVL